MSNSKRIKILCDAMHKKEKDIFLENPYTGTIMSKRDWEITYKKLQRDDELYRKYGTYKTHCEEGFECNFNEFIHEFVEVVQLEPYGEWSFKE